MGRLIVFLGLALIVVQGLTGGQFTQLMQAMGLSPAPTGGNKAAGLPPANNAPVRPGTVGAAGGGFGGNFQP